jgi:aspartyl-tRNA(Asn)/glutamyl-tRNA(Gln) amidotransferase subunit A
MPNTFSLSQAARKIQSGDLSPVDLLNACFDRINHLDDRIKAWVTIHHDNVLRDAQAAHDEIVRGNYRGPLHGIPIGIKDIIFTNGVQTQGGSDFLKNFVPDYDATVVTRLKEAGAIILGKTATTEYASYDPAETCNPYNTGHTPGGSSSGSAAAVAARMCPAALGSQTGGSISRPAAYCGLVGFKPTYGRVSVYGVLPLSFSLDHVGPLTRSVEDAAIVFQTIAGFDPCDSLSVIRKVPDCIQAVNTALERPPRIGLIRSYFEDQADEAMRGATELAIEAFKAGHAEVREIVLPKNFKHIHNKHRLIMYAEAAACHAERFERNAKKFGPNIRQLIQEGLLLPAVAYADARQHQLAFRAAMRSVFGNVDVLITPATPTPAPEGLSSTGDPAFNAPWSHAGLPTIVLPVTLSDGLPCGIQLIGPEWQEDRLLQIAHWCETHLGFEAQPNLV